MLAAGACALRWRIARRGAGSTGGALPGAGGVSRHPPTRPPSPHQATPEFLRGLSPVHAHKGPLLVQPCRRAAVAGSRPKAKFFAVVYDHRRDGLKLIFG